VLQGAYGLYGALGGDALNHYVLDPLDRALFQPERKLSDLVTGQQPRGRSFFGTGGRSYRDAASQLADDLGMRKPETARERVISDIGEGLTGTALTMGVGGLLNQGRNVATNPTIANRVGGLLTAQPTLQTISTATGSGAAAIAREKGYGPGTQLAAGLVGGLAPGGISAGTAASTRALVRGRSGVNMQRTIEDFA